MAGTEQVDDHPYRGTAVRRDGDGGSVPAFRGGIVGDAGMATAEYAVATLAAVGFAGLLFAVLRSGEVQGMLTELVRRALTTL